MTLYLVRHANAGSRADWDGPDSERPLSGKGRRQADALTAHLADAPVKRVLSSAAVRCRQTVALAADIRDLDIEVHDALTEGASAAQTTTLLYTLAEEGDDVVLCSHGDVIPAAIEALRGDGVDVGNRHGLPKGTLYVLDVDPDSTIARATFVDPRG
ncbi:MAG TPA: phosphoglycerate mutase family protein [Iamia sp.]|nr:phosphoglycerate mutase family protein [Iamia sp.]